MTFVGNLLGHLSDEVSFVVDRCLFLFQTLFNCNFWIVRTVLGALAFVGQRLVDLLVTLLVGLSQCLDDFKSFIFDLLDIGMTVLNGLGSFFQMIWYGTISGVQWTAALLVNCVWWLSTTVSWLTNCGLALIQLVVRAITLLWEGTLATLSLFPRLLLAYWMYLCSIVTSCVEKLSRGYETLHRVGRSVLLGIYNAPRDAYLGLVLCVLTWYLFKHFDLFRRIQVSVAKTPAMLKQLVSALSQRLNRESAAIADETRQVQDEPVMEQTRRDEIVHNVPTARSGMKRMMQSATASVEDSEDVDVVLRLRKEVEQLQEINLCVVCQERSRCVTLLPCRHLCLCQPCTTRILETKPVCPMCRLYVGDILQVYT